LNFSNSTPPNTFNLPLSLLGGAEVTFNKETPNRVGTNEKMPSVGHFFIVKLSSNTLESAAYTNRVVKELSYMII